MTSDQDEYATVEQAEKGFDGLTFFVYRTLLDAGVKNAEEVNGKIKTGVKSGVKTCYILLHLRGSDTTEDAHNTA